MRPDLYQTFFTKRSDLFLEVVKVNSIFISACLLVLESPGFFRMLLELIFKFFFEECHARTDRQMDGQTD